MARTGIRRHHTTLIRSPGGPLEECLRALPLAALLMAAVATPAKAQFGGAVLGGAYVPASDFYRLRQAGEELRIQREATVALGANLEYAPFRLSLATQPAQR
jgi:hypothetical protein